MLCLLLLNSCSKQILLLTNTKVDGKFIIPYEITGTTRPVQNSNLKTLNNNIFDTSFQFVKTISTPPELYEDLSHKSNDTLINLKFFIGKKGSDLYFVGDQNFDTDFNNDSFIVIYNFFNDTSHIWLRQFNDKIFYSFNIINKNLRVNPLRLFLSIDISKSPANLTAIGNKSFSMQITFTKPNSYKVAKFQINSRKHFVVMDDLPVAKIWGTATEKLYFLKDQDVSAKYNLDYNLGYLSKDTIRLSNKDWVINLLDNLGDSIKLMKIKKRKRIVGVTPNTYIPAMTFKEMGSNNLISLASPLKKKITALFFWGTWCGPCMSKMPQYNLLYDSINKNDVDLIGVCWDYPEDSVFIKEEIIKNKIFWSNIFADIHSKSNSICNKLRIENAPFYIILNQQGKITYRGGEFEKVRQILLKVEE